MPLLYLAISIALSENHAQTVGLCSVWDVHWNEIVYLLIHMFKLPSGSPMPPHIANRIRVWAGDLGSDDDPALSAPSAAALAYFPNITSRIIFVEIM